MRVLPYQACCSAFYCSRFVFSHFIIPDLLFRTLLFHVSALCVLPQPILRVCLSDKMKLSAGIRVRVLQKLDIVDFWSWNLDAVVFRCWNLDVGAFCSLKKCLGITMSRLNCLHFPMPRCFSHRISMLWLFGLGISMLWFFGFGISMCLHGLVFLSLWKQKKSRKLISIILLRNIPIIQLYETAIFIMYA